MAATTTMSSKGQVIIPKSLRDELKWTPGTELVVEMGDGGVVLRPARSFPVTSVEDLVGSAGYRGPRRSLDDMKRGIARGARSRRR